MNVTNADRELFPGEGITKGDVVAHYARVSARILPYLEGRPITLHRFPKGIGEKGFMQKNAQVYFPDSIGRIELPKKDGTTVYPEIHDEEGLLYLANLSVITFHAPTSRQPDLWRPDRFIIDLDPAEGDVAMARRAATIAGDYLGELGLATVPMATGSKGYHVVAPIIPDLGYDRVSRFAQAVGTLLADAHPDELTLEFRIANRQGKVFVDWMRNHGLATAVAPWSLRARPGAPVAVPITWDELSSSDPDRWTIFDLDDRLAMPDPLGELEPVSLVPALEAIEALVEREGIELPVFDRFRS